MREWSSSRLLDLSPLVPPVTAPLPAATIVNVGYRSTNFWVVSVGSSRLLVDLGWPGMFKALEANLKRADIPLREIRHGLATHYHIDHAGAAQDLNNAGMRLIVTPEQVGSIAGMKTYIKKGEPYTEITSDGNVVVPCDESRAFLAGIGIAGVIVHAGTLRRQREPGARHRRRVHRRPHPSVAGQRRKRGDGPRELGQ